MDELERYLDRVCRGIAGPRALRKHVREELREHLRDAVAEHVAAGLAEPEAVARALEEFGRPEEIGAELEGTHGHRLLTTLIDKAMEWKEATMKPKLLWSSWAHGGLAGAIAVMTLFLGMAVVFVLPKFLQFAHEGWLGVDQGEAGEFVGHCIGFLWGVVAVIRYVWWWGVPLGVGWLLFEWRNRSEHKALIRLGAMGVIALLLAVVTVLFAAALVLPLVLAMPGMEVRHPEPVVAARAAEVETGVAELERAAAAGDWQAARASAMRAAHAMEGLARMGAAAPVLVARRAEAGGGNAGNIDAARLQLAVAEAAMRDLRRAALHHDAAGVRAALERFRAAYGAVKGPAGK